MTSYIQTTIYSKIAKYPTSNAGQEKTSSEGFGTLFRGRITNGRSGSK